MKNCHSIEKQLTAYLHGELNEAQYEDVHAHLEDCASCRIALEAQRATLDLLGEALDGAPVPENICVHCAAPKPVRVHKLTWNTALHNRDFLAGMGTAAIACLFFMLVLWLSPRVREVYIAQTQLGEGGRARMELGSPTLPAVTHPEDVSPYVREYVADVDTDRSVPIDLPTVVVKPHEGRGIDENVAIEELIAALAEDPEASPDLSFPTFPDGKENPVLGQVKPPTANLTNQIASRVDALEREVPKKSAPPPVMPAPVECDRMQVAGDCFGAPVQCSGAGFAVGAPVMENTEQYDAIVEGGFKASLDQPLSTFSIDVDRASYANVRRFLNDGQLPPPDAVRIEELINYFSYDYPAPDGVDPFSVNMELAACPWNAEHQLVLIGLQGQKIATENLPPNNLTFLLDVSGSMNSSDKLPLLKAAMRLLVDQLRPQDRVSIVVYAGAAGIVLEPTANKSAILAAIEKLDAGGSTAGGAGIELAYKTAQEAFIDGGNNRVVLATDGDFNVGVSSDEGLVKLIEEKRESGIFLSVLGFGTGNLKDSKMEKLANKGNGNYAYIDDVLEAKKVLVTEMGGTLVTIAKDVKIQVEFNPAEVKSYRLVGYENRMLNKEDFADDTKDAGELGAGHTVTALYELVPATSTETVPAVGELKYQTNALNPSDELMTVKLRYKAPDGDTSKLLSHAVKSTGIQKAPSQNLRFAAAVAEFGQLLRDSEHKGTSSYASVLKRAREAKGVDLEGYRAEFIRLVEKAALLEQ